MSYEHFLFYSVGINRQVSKEENVILRLMVTS